MIADWLLTDADSFIPPQTTLLIKFRVAYEAAEWLLIICGFFCVSLSELPG